MKIHLFLYILIYLFCTSCNSDEDQIVNTTFDELKKSTINEFYYNYKHDPVRHMHYKKLMDEFVAYTKKLHLHDNKEPILKSLDTLKVIIQKINTHSRWNAELINKEVEKLNEFTSSNLQKYKTQLDLIEYLVANELLKASNNDVFMIDKINIGFFQKASSNKDSIDLIITPIPEFYYKPLITINGDTIQLRNHKDGTANIRVSKPENSLLHLKGLYQLRRNYNYHIFPIDTTLRINN